jgi:simple sugar transport system permease protein
MRKLKSLFRKDLQLSVLILVTIGILVLMLLALGQKMYNPRNFSSMAFQISEFAVLSLGMGVTMLLGGIDLSIVANANLSGIMAAFVMTNKGLLAAIGEPMTVALAMIVAIVVATAAGTLNGLLITKFSVNPIVATLGTMIFYTGISMAATGGEGITGFPKSFAGFGKASLLGIPYVFLLFLVIAFIFTFVMGRTGFGKKIYMIGENHTAARFSSIDNEKLVTVAYAIAGMMAGFAAIMIIARVNSAKVGYGDTYLLQAILVCVLAGISPSGGKGKIVGIILALFCIQILQSAFTLWQFTPYAKRLIWGIMLLGLLFINKAVDYMDVKKQKELLLRQVKAAKDSKGVKA